MSGPEALGTSSRVQRRRAERAAAATVRRRGRWEIVAIVAVALLVAVGIRAYLVQAFSIPSGSMEQTLLVGDRILVNKSAYRFGEIQRGDIVVFDGTDSFVQESATAPGEGWWQRSRLAVGRWIGTAPGERDFVKRVIGVGGDRVICCDAAGRITVNGASIDESGYLYPGDAPSQQQFDVVVPDGRLWVMGDHRSVSRDSRAYLGAPGGGFVPGERVKGRAVSVIWPASRWGGLPRPEAFDEVPSGAGG
jgi:signal peptidase I